MKLQKQVPAHTKTLTAEWCRRDYAMMSESWRRIRSSQQDKRDRCYWCEYEFENGDVMALAKFAEDEQNRMLCQSCADELIASHQEATP